MDNLFTEFKPGDVITNCHTSLPSKVLKVYKDYYVIDLRMTGTKFKLWKNTPGHAEYVKVSEQKKGGDE